jgi:AraC-like DNA-binding protein
MPAQKLAFSSPGAAAGPAEAKRLARWWDEYRATLGGVEVAIDHDMPFATSVEYVGLGATGLGRSVGSINRFERRNDHHAQDGDDRFYLVVNCGVSETLTQTRAVEVALPAGGAVLYDYAERSVNICPGGHSVLALMFPRALLCRAMTNVEDRIGTVVPADNEALRLLRGYSSVLLDSETLSDPGVLSQAGQSLLDLAVLALGSGRDATEAARRPGLRAVRLEAVLERIRRDYADPDITAETVAERVGVSTRYLHMLLQETGASFSEQIRELRLARALALLTGGARAMRKISDTAYEAGFNDLSYFNRSFRRKYGLTPTAARGRPGR